MKETYKINRYRIIGNKKGKENNKEKCKQIHTIKYL